MSQDLVKALGITPAEKKASELWEERKEVLPGVQYKSDRENFIAGLLAALELVEVKELEKALESYARGDHFQYLGDEDHAPEDVSGEPPNILFGGAEGSEFQFEDGSWAKIKLESWRSFRGEK